MASGIYGMFLNFGVPGVDPSDVTSRSYGFQLRCLSE